MHGIKKIKGSYFVENISQRCHFERILYIESVEPSDILILCPYVDNLHFTRNNMNMITKFRKAMVNHFEINYLSFISFFLGIKVGIDPLNLIFHMTRSYMISHHEFKM